MNTEEAKNLLGLSGDPTEEEIKKAFRKKAAQFHPDRNKDPDAENQFKKVNEAHQLLTNPQPEQHHFQGGNPFQGGSIHDFFANMGGFGFGGQETSRQHHAPPIHLSLNLTFEESILGTKKPIKFKRFIRCEDCLGQGSKKINNGCDKCGGKGQVVQQQGPMTTISTCPKCHGRRSPSIPCLACKEDGRQETEIEINITIPGGISNGNTMRLGQMGNYGGNFGMAPQSSDVFVELKVKEDNHLRLENGEVMSDLELSLLEALEGTEKSVRTVNGVKKIVVPPLTKHKDVVRIEEAGVMKGNKQGPHRVNLEVLYPDDLSHLIEALKTKETSIEGKE